MRISDWSSDVCSSDLEMSLNRANTVLEELLRLGRHHAVQRLAQPRRRHHIGALRDRLVKQPARRRRGHQIHDTERARRLARDRHIKSEARRVGTECVSTWRYRWSPYQ